jgi:hypothetical protein
MIVHDSQVIGYAGLIGPFFAAWPASLPQFRT